MDNRRYTYPNQRYSRFLCEQWTQSICNENKLDIELVFMRVKNNPYVIKDKCKQIQDIKNANNNRD